MDYKIKKTKNRIKVDGFFSGEMSEAARLDEELMNTRVDPVILKRTVNQQVRQRSRAAERMPSPIRRSTYPPRRSPSPYYSSGRMVSQLRKGIFIF